MKRTVKILTVALIVFPILMGGRQYGYASTDDLQETYKNLEVFSNVLSIVQQNYVDDVDTKETLEGAIKGMLTSLDPHSSFLKPDDFKELQVETKGSFSGIGIEITIKDDMLTVVSPIEDTPAFKAGIKAGDRIIKINGESTKDMTIFEAVKILRGPKDTEVTISVHREDWTDIQEFTIIRGVIPIHSIRANILEPGYGYIRITNFQRNTSVDLNKSIDDFLKEGALKGLVLDLRNNPGGLLDVSVKVADIFLDEGIIVSTKGRIKEQNMEFSAHGGGPDYEFPIVVLINGGSASASEIVAGALQDHKRALILGTQSFGKGSVQTIIPMGDGAGLRLTTARYYTPNGTSIQATGITPDVLVPEADSKEDDAEKGPKSFLREKDLKHHLENGGDIQLKPEPQTIEKSGLISDKVTIDEKTKEKLKNDNQLNTALLVLKSLNVLSKSGSEK
ncbi:MAG: S41 family peptidase [Deltaproteobacteria bacterium]|jgi:carboxyl-terminal processing protease|nr:S41 family peptidase [Deltaproteobacteria bacterium]